MHVMYMILCSYVHESEQCSQTVHITLSELVWDVTSKIHTPRMSSKIKWHQEVLRLPIGNEIAMAMCPNVFCRFACPEPPSKVCTVFEVMHAFALLQLEWQNGAL